MYLDLKKVNTVFFNKKKELMKKFEANILQKMDQKANEDIPSISDISNLRENDKF